MYIAFQMGESFLLAPYLNPQSSAPHSLHTTHTLTFNWQASEVKVLSTFYLTCKDEMVTCACVCVSAGPDSEGAV